MKSVLVFSDLHANKEALKEISAKIDQVDLSIFCGDILGYGNDIEYSVDFIRNKVDLAVQGNHDRMCISTESLENQLNVVRESAIRTRQNLTRDQIDFISSLPLEIWYEDFYITHSVGDLYLRSLTDFNLLLKKGKSNTKYFLFGHTHEKVFCKVENKIILNPGSITKGRNNFKRGYVIIKDGEIEIVDLEALI